MIVMIDLMDIISIKVIVIYGWKIFKIFISNNIKKRIF